MQETRQLYCVKKHMKTVRTRIAPSPTGFPHIGTIYQALFDFAFAKRHNGDFILRIEDTDRERFIAGAEEKIYDALDWFNLSEDESPRHGGEYGPYRQSERLSLYQQYAKELIVNGHAYYCFCTKERLEEIRAKLMAEKKQLMYDRHCRRIPPDEAEKRAESGEVSVIRLKVPENEKISFRDLIRGEIVFDSSTIDDQVLLKSDGFPTYHLAVVVDDHFMKISHIVRGEEWITSTPKHVLLYRFFGWEMPLFFHTPVLRNPQKAKLSKRHGHTNVSWYQDEGFLPEAILNFLSLMGWSHPDGKEIFSLDEFISLFDLKDVKPIGPIFDLQKLHWMNQQYISALSDEQLLMRLVIHIPSLARIDQTLLLSVIPLVKTRMETLNDFLLLTKHFFSEPEIIPRSEGEKKIIVSLQKELRSIHTWEKESIFASLKTIMSSYSIRMPVLYYLLTGEEKGLPLPESLEILGKEKVVCRLDHIRENS